MRRAAAVLTAIASLAALAPSTVSAAEEGTVQLAFYRPLAAPVVDQTQARALFNDVNAARAQRGLPALAGDPRLNKLALEVAQQMAARHYFGHTDPNGITFEDRLRASGFRFRYAAENMAFDEDEAHANQAFLHSPGHYANIVDPNPHRLGTAVVAAGNGEIFYVEEFSD